MTNPILRNPDISFLKDGKTIKVMDINNPDPIYRVSIYEKGYWQKILSFLTIKGAL